MKKLSLVVLKIKEFGVFLANTFRPKQKVMVYVRKNDGSVETVEVWK